MVSQRCKMMVEAEFKKLGIHSASIELGRVDVLEAISAQQLVNLKASLLHSGLELLDDKKGILVEKIKNVVTEMIHYSEELPILKYSDFISKKLGYDYTYLANIFSEAQGTTIQQFIINNKIEKIKELMLYNELSLTEIAWKLHYSSLGHLCNQFKKTTGLTPSVYRLTRQERLHTLESI